MPAIRSSLAMRTSWRMAASYFDLRPFNARKGRVAIQELLSDTINISRVRVFLVTGETVCCRSAVNGVNCDLGPV
jgi:hypothetical protein